MFQEHALDLAFSRVSDQSLTVSESHIRGGRAVPLVICNDLHLGKRLVTILQYNLVTILQKFHLPMLKDANTGVGGAKVDTDGSFLLSDHDWCFINKPLEEVKL